jgi:hypothetical protein
MEADKQKEEHTVDRKLIPDLLTKYEPEGKTLFGKQIDSNTFREYYDSSMVRYVLSVLQKPI